MACSCHCYSPLADYLLSSRMKKILSALAIATMLAAPQATPAQVKSDEQEELLHGLKYRSVGPSRGGRVTTVCGVAGEIHTFYMGSTGGGVWKTTDAGTTWENISDEYFDVGSIGAVAVAPSDPNVVYVGTGSGCPRGNISIGKGLYKSTDKGASWQKMGLEATGMIGKLEIHPTDPDIVYAAALGNPFKPNEERGVYKTEDGGVTWQKVLHVSDRTGAVDVEMDPSNPRILYAAMWTVERKPWTLIDGSTEGGIWRSKDSGTTWTKLTEGLPDGEVGRAGITISPANPQKIWIIQEAAEEKKGGLYHSADGGKTWNRINREHNLRQRAWYYNHVEAHPTDENTLFIMNVRFHKSIDGGKNFSTISTPHGDNHALWINPEHPEIMIEGNDGGANVTLNGGKTWSSIYNQPTAEFYRVSVDNQYPYRLYGAQQDNSTISVSSRPHARLDPRQDWYPVGGGESGHIAVDPNNPDLIYAGTYIGQITRKDRKRDHIRDVVAYPQMHDGTAGRDIKYRFQWNAPIRLSPHDPSKLYHCSQYVHLSQDGGQSWEVISPDLTTDKDEYQDIPGGPIQHDHTGVELYTTIFSFEESPINPGELWAGSDDGLLHLSRDAGGTWTNITPPNMPVEGTINTIDLSVHASGRAVISVFKYREGDFRPYVFLTNDHGKSWQSLTDGTNGIPDDHFVRVVREDPNRRGLFYAGTEFGMYISFDDGAHWQSFQQNLPVTPITDLQVHQGDLVVATQGRSFWIMDDLSPLSRWSPQEADQVVLFASTGAVRTQVGSRRSLGGIDAAPNGALIYYYLPEKPDTSQSIKLLIKDRSGVVRRTFSTDPDKEAKEEKLEVKKGLNRHTWNLRYESPEVQKGAFFSLASMSGIHAPPGTHQVTLQVGQEEHTQDLEVGIDPRWDQTPEDLMQQYELTLKARNSLEETHASIGDLRTMRDELKRLLKRADLSDTALTSDLRSLQEDITALEAQLIQTKNESGQDPINYPSMIDDQIAYLYSVLNGQDAAPTEGAYQRLQDLEQELQPLFGRVDQIRGRASELNLRLKQIDLPAISAKKREGKP